MDGVTAIGEDGNLHLLEIVARLPEPVYEAKLAPRNRGSAAATTAPAVLVTAVQ